MLLLTKSNSDETLVICVDTFTLREAQSHWLKSKLIIYRMEHFSILLKKFWLSQGNMFHFQDGTPFKQLKYILFQKHSMLFRNQYSYKICSSIRFNCKVSCECSIGRKNRIPLKILKQPVKEVQFSLQETMSLKISYPLAYNYIVHEGYYFLSKS